MHYLFNVFVLELLFEGMIPAVGTPTLDLLKKNKLALSSEQRYILKESLLKSCPVCGTYCPVWDLSICYCYFW